MKLVSFTKDQRASWGAIVEAGIVDLGHPSVSTFPDLKSFLSAGSPREILDTARGADFGLDDVSLLPVVPNPDKIVMAALNYHEKVATRPNFPPIPYCSCACPVPKSPMEIR